MSSWSALEAMSFSIPQVIMNLCLAFSLSFLVATLHRKLQEGPTSASSFTLTLLVTPVVVCMIMMAIGSNVALSLGLVGALSIVRFRTVIKDTVDMSFLFLTIGIGLCCGAGAYALAIFGATFVCLIALVLKTLFVTRRGLGEYILVFRQSAAQQGSAGEVIDDLVSWQKLHSVADLGTNEGCEYTYRVRLGKSLTPDALIRRLKQIDGLSQSSLISPESQLAL